MREREGDGRGMERDTHRRERERASHQMPFFVQVSDLASAVEKGNTMYRGRVEEGKVGGGRD